MSNSTKYVLGRPIETSAGQIKHIRVEEYDDYTHYLQMMAQDKSYIVYSYLKMEKSPELLELVEQIVDMEFYEVVLGLPHYRAAYEVVYEKSFVKKEDIDNISYDNFEEIRKVILQLNCVKIQKAAINMDKDHRSYLSTKVQEAFDRSARVKAQDAKSMGQEPPELQDIISVVVVGANKSYEEIADWSMYQLYMAYSRYSQIQAYKSSVLFATVSTDPKIESWSNPINLFEDTKHYIEEDKFNSKYKDLKNT